MRQTGVAQPPGATRIGRWAGKVLPVPGILVKSYPAHSAVRSVYEQDCPQGSCPFTCGRRKLAKDRGGKRQGASPPQPRVPMDGKRRHSDRRRRTGRGRSARRDPVPPAAPCGTSFGVSELRYLSEDGRSGPSSATFPKPIRQRIRLWTAHQACGFKPRTLSSGDPGWSALLR